MPKVLRKWFQEGYTSRFYRFDARTNTLTGSLHLEKGHYRKFYKFKVPVIFDGVSFVEVHDKLRLYKLERTSGLPRMRDRVIGKDGYPVEWKFPPISLDEVDDVIISNGTPFMLVRKGNYVYVVGENSRGQAGQGKSGNTYKSWQKMPGLEEDKIGKIKGVYKTQHPYFEENEESFIIETTKGLYGVGKNDNFELLNSPPHHLKTVAPLMNSTFKRLYVPTELMDAELRLLKQKSGTLALPVLHKQSKVYFFANKTWKEVPIDVDDLDKLDFTDKFEYFVYDDGRKYIIFDRYNNQRFELPKLKDFHNFQFVVARKHGDFTGNSAILIADDKKGLPNVVWYTSKHERVPFRDGIKKGFSRSVLPEVLEGAGLVFNSQVYLPIIVHAECSRTGV